MSSRASLKVLVVMEHPGIGTLMPALKLLHDRGHRVHLAFESMKSVESHHELQALAEECPGIVFAQLPSIEASGWAALAVWLRRSVDYVRYLEPRYRDATELRARAGRKAPKTVRRLGRLAGFAGPAGISTLGVVLRAIERCLRPPAEVERFLAEQAPDILIPTHLLPFGTPHADYLRAANRLGIHTVFPVRGWDNLTNKGLLKDAPELMLVWNETQAWEAEELHRVPRERIRLTGSALCDHWFDWSPSRDRETFCDEVGLRADRPIVLYMCSSGFVARDKEAAFVRGWVERLRARGGMLAEAGFLIRPHPLNAAQWAGFGSDEDGVRVWPRFGEAPHDEASRQNFFDSIFHAAAVVGINTTAQIESAIVGRPVHTLLADEFRDTQQGTLHFQYLRADEFGHLLVGRTFDEHAEQLEESLRGRPADGRSELFLRRFVRPLGLDRSATEVIVEEIEELGSRPALAPDDRSRLEPVVRLGLAPFAAHLGRGLARRRKSVDPQLTPVRELRRAAHTRALHRAGMPVVAGPWLEDEVGELLYWIPFLRWVQASGTGVRERLFVVCKDSTGSWYEGIGAGWIGVDELLAPAGFARRQGPVGEEELEGALRGRVAQVFRLGSRAFRVLPAGLVAAARASLARQKADAPIEKRLLEYAPIVPPDLPTGLELPDGFLGVLLPPERMGIADALATRLPTVSLEGLDRSAQTAVIARARGFLGTLGVEAILAVLSGVQTVVLASAAARVADDDLRLLSSFLSEDPYGRLHTLEPIVSDEEAVERAVRLFGAPAALAV